MFIVFNKQKIYSYLVALSTVVILFIFAFAITNQPNDVVETSTNLEEINNIITNQESNVQLEQKNIIEVNKTNAEENY